MKNFKKVLLTGVLIAVMTSTVYAGAGINVTINGTAVQFTDATPYVDENGRTMMPVAKMGQLLKVQVIWNNETQTVTLKDSKNLVTLKLMDDNITINGVTSKMDTRAVNNKGRTYVPLTAIAKAFGVTTGWDNKTNTVALKTDKLDPEFEFPIKIDNELGYKPEEFSVINGNTNNNYVISGDYMYYKSNFSGYPFKRKNLTTGKEELFTDFKNINNLQGTDDYLFFSKSISSGGEVTGLDFYRVDKDGTNDILAPIELWQGYYQVYNDKIYYTTKLDTNLVTNVCDLNFENNQFIKNGTFDIIVDNKMYDAHMSTGKLSISIFDLYTLESKVVSGEKATGAIGQVSFDIKNNNYGIYSNNDDGSTVIYVFNKNGELVKYDTLQNNIYNKSFIIYNNIAYYPVKEDGVYSYNIETGETNKIIEGKYARLYIVDNYLIVKGLNHQLAVYDISKGAVVTN